MTEKNENATKEKANVSIHINKDKYVATKTSKGTKSLSNGDDIALALEGLTIEQVHKAGKTLLGMDTAEKYANLNEGMQRMNVGNRIRSAIHSTKEGTLSVANLAKVTGPMQKSNAAEHKRAAAEKAREAKAKAKEAAAKAKADTAKAA